MTGAVIGYAQEKRGEVARPERLELPTLRFEA